MLAHEELLHQISKGNKQAFESFYLIFKDKVYNTALCYLQNVEDAEEVTQDVFLSIYEKAHSFKGNSKPSTWVYRITVNKALSQMDKVKRRPSSGARLEDYHQIEFKHPGVILENQEKSGYLFSAIKTLVESQKTAFILIYMEGLSQKEVATIMGNTEKSIESLLQRAKSNLRKKIILRYPEGNN